MSEREVEFRLEKYTDSTSTVLTMNTSLAVAVSVMGAGICMRMFMCAYFCMYMFMSTCFCMYMFMVAFKYSKNYSTNEQCNSQQQDYSLSGRMKHWFV